MDTEHPDWWSSKRARMALPEEPEVGVEPTYTAFLGDPGLKYGKAVSEPIDRSRPLPSCERLPDGSLLLKPSGLIVRSE